VTAPVPQPLCDPFNPVPSPPGCVPAQEFVPQVVAFYRDLATRAPNLVQTTIGLTPDQVERIGNVTVEVLNVSSPSVVSAKRTRWRWTSGQSLRWSASVLP
jgi:hypothetical protein